MAEKVEACIILPDCDNAGKPIEQAHAVLQSVLLDIAGGYTAHAVSGAWRDSGKVYRDSSKAYTVLCTASDVKTIRQFIHDQLIILSKQETILFTVRQLSIVDFVD